MPEEFPMQELLLDLRNTIQEYEERLLAITDQEARESRHTGEWTPKEIVGHLIDSAANNHTRFVRAQLEQDLVFPTYAQEEWVRAGHYNDESWYHLVQLWKRYNLHIIHLISHIPQETLQRPRARHNLDQIGWQRVSADQPTTLDYLIRDYVGHLKDHLRQIVAQRENL
jgi:hypothetical protein